MKAKKRKKPDAPSLEDVHVRHAVKITEHIRKTIGKDTEGPVARQYVPHIDELNVSPQESADPIGDNAHSPVKGIVHRYPDRVLLKLSGVCAVYCRYCFRKEMIGPEAGILSAEEQAGALAYIQNNKTIWEVILTGGDPLVLSPRRLKAVLDKLENIKHVQVIRIHTRVPVADPARITPALCNALPKNRTKPVYMVLHINHAREITPEVLTAIMSLQTAGCNLLSQSVLLKGVNDDAKTLETLFRRLVTLKVKPYYLHHPDMVPGTGHFRLSIRRGQEIVKALRGHVSGLCLPTYMLDIPGGYGKVPVNACYLKELEKGSYLVEDYQGRKHHYTS